VRSDRQRLRDILQAIAQIEQYTIEGRAAFEQDNLIQDGVLYQFVIIGEAARAMSTQLREKNLYVPWAEMVAMRNILVHRYYEVNLSPIWLVVEQNLPELKGKIEAILQGLGIDA
jgi:uncharacterized protein with HEPN domain